MSPQPEQGGGQPARQARFHALFSRGTELLLAGQAGAALPLLRQAHRLDQSHIQAALNLAGAFILTRRFKDAQALLERLREQEPENPAIWQNLGAAYLGNPVLAREEQQLLAIAAFRRALELDPTARHVAYNIGLIHRDRQERDQAIVWLRRAVEADPDDEQAQRLLRRLLPETG